MQRVVLFVRDRTLFRQSSEVLAGAGCAIEVWQDAVNRSHGWEAATVVVIDEENANLSSEDLTDVLQRCTCILLQTGRDAGRTTKALRDGFRECLLMPEDLALLPEALLRCTTAKVQEPLRASARAKILTLFSATGGSGRSTVAAHMACGLSQAGFRTLVVDLNLNFGALRQVFGVTGTSSVADLLPVLHELTDNHLKNAVDSLSPTLDLLAAPHTSMHQALTEQEIGQLLEAFSHRYDVMVVDLPAGLDEISLSVLSRSNRGVYLLEPTPIGLWALGAVLSRLDPGDLPRDRLQVVVNHRSHQLVQLGGVDVNRLYWLPILGEISHDPNTSISPVLDAWADVGKVQGIARDVSSLVDKLRAGDGTPLPPIDQVTVRLGFGSKLRRLVSGR